MHIIDLPVYMLSLTLVFYTMQDIDGSILEEKDIIFLHR